jgi:hypothetical protein
VALYLLKVTYDSWVTTVLFWLSFPFLFGCALITIPLLIAELLEHQRTERIRQESDEQQMRVLSEVSHRIAEFQPPLGPFGASGYLFIPPNKVRSIIAMTAGTGLAGYVEEDFDTKKLVTAEDWFPIISPELRAVLKKQVRFGFDDELRFSGQWIVGAQGSGKTNLLSVQIAADLDRVAKGECSLFILDSQNELIPQIARLDRFLSGGDLEGKLIYLEPQASRPLALNPFDLTLRPGLSEEGREALISGATQMVKFFLSSILETDTSGQQRTMLEYVIPAVMEIPGATLVTLRQLVDEGGRALVEQHLRHLDTYEWLSKTLHSNDLRVTRVAIRNRIDGMLANRYFRGMFSSPANALDLFQELQDGKVVLINTKKGVLKDATAPFGRFFIARLLQATEERMLLPKANRKPVFAYIDEASDYVASDANVEELIDKARKQRVGLTFANQRVEQIDSTAVLSALRNCQIQFFNGAMKTWELSVRRAPAILVDVPHVDFATQPHISDYEFDMLREYMAERFGAAAVKEIIEPEILPPQRTLPPPGELPTGPEKY